MTTEREMGVAKIRTSSVSGISAEAVEVEVRVRMDGKPRVSIIGLGDNAVREARDRVESAIRQSRFNFPKQVLVNLAPAELKKEGSSFDLPIAVGILLASRQIVIPGNRRRSFYGELSLDGRVKPVRGIIAHTIESFRSGIKEVIVPRDNLEESSLISEVSSVGIRTLSELVAFLIGEHLPDSLEPTVVHNFPPTTGLSEVCGQEEGKRALIVAAAGAHNVLLVGVPGAGKSMLAERFPSLLPPLNREEILDVVRVHSIAGLPINRFLHAERPFRRPHHGISEPGLIGGGSFPRPGEISLAHHGVLFLDEFPEFRRTALEAMRAPLESGQVHITRAKGTAEFPSRFQLIAAMNPCPCGRLGSEEHECICSPPAVERYLSRLSQPILDRIDLHVELRPVPIEVIAKGVGNSDHDRETISQILEARERAFSRSGKPNAFLTNRELQDTVRIDERAKLLLERITKKRHLSARAYFRILKVAQTIADLEGNKGINSSHVAEATGYRTLDLTERYLGRGRVSRRP